ncbi:MAG: tRNA (guanosine(46)-N7)-methyltransferase TrmB [Oscillospiraceae bacterium]
MRKKPNLIPRMERCETILEKEPQRLKGGWLREYPGFSELHLELGCGKGRFTANMAESNPSVLFAAIEKVPDAMVVAMERVFERELKNVRFLDFDAAGCLDVFEPGEVDRIYINFPDPWLKKKQFKRRLTAPAFLKIYEQLLKPEGEIWFKTDNRPLFDWSLEQFESGGWKLSEVTNDLHAAGKTGVMTDYETKFYEQGVPINRLVAKRTGA